MGSKDEEIDIDDGQKVRMQLRSTSENLTNFTNLFGNFRSCSYSEEMLPRFHVFAAVFSMEVVLALSLGWEHSWAHRDRGWGCTSDSQLSSARHLVIGSHVGE